MNGYDDTRPQLTLVGGLEFEKNKLGVPLRYRGVRFARVLRECHPQGNTSRLEEGFAREWAERNESSLLERLLCTDENDPQRKFVPQTEREWEVAHLVAATVIQWLPTSIGCNFLRSAFKKGGGDFAYRMPES